MPGPPAVPPLTARLLASAPRPTGPLPPTRVSAACADPRATPRRGAVLMLLALLTLATLGTGCAHTAAPEPTLDLHQVDTSLMPPDSALHALTLATDRAIREERSVAALVESNPAATTLLADRARRVVFVSWTNGAASALVGVASGIGLVEATERAIGRLGDEVKPEHTWGVSIDVVDSMRAIDTPPPIRVARDAGLLFDTGEALLSEQLRARALLQGRKFAPPRLERTLNGPTHIFTTRTFATIGERSVEVRDRRPVTDRPFPDPLSDAELEASLRHAESYLSSLVDEEGKFLYQVDTATGRLDPDYNLARHAGTLYWLIGRYSESGDRLTLAACERAAAFLVAQGQPMDANGAVAIVESGVVKLTANALACLALAQYALVTGDALRAEDARSIGRYIVSLQGEDGRYAPHTQTFAQRVDRGTVSAYAPGEANLALATLHRVDDGGPWLRVAELNTRYLIEVRDAGIDQEPHDHWLLYSLDALDALKPNPRYVSKAKRIVASIVETQLLSPEDDPGYGGWRSTAGVRLAPSATRAEGLLAAARLLRRAGEEEFARRAIEGAERAAGFLVRCQIQPEASFHLRVPRSFTGGFRARLEWDEVRIDFVQHAAAAIEALLHWRQTTSTD